jgi:hypothetical protein
VPLTLVGNAVQGKSKKRVRGVFVGTKILGVDGLEAIGRRRTAASGAMLRHLDVDPILEQGVAIAGGAPARSGGVSTK